MPFACSQSALGSLQLLAQHPIEMIRPTSPRLRPPPVLPVTDLRSAPAGNSQHVSICGLAVGLLLIQAAHGRIHVGSRGSRGGNTVQQPAVCQGDTSQPVPERSVMKRYQGFDRPTGFF
ncbi:hypothetical protein CERSUDRAFT_101341 [Gelatoporia subvermispora B]|uniref:Uncharacterized protein n=1 Tax=Ceriporiopsis subvermispora (strain B) TaxID=914234 RepID=M2P5I4_CERS8|nr:hypothetical protein CERSUDRAFT_101341 [Gelatoporia subvermispora B]